MKRNEPREPAKEQPERVVVVEASKYTELLISRRKLDRVSNGHERLFDLETKQIYVLEPESSRRLAKGA